MAIEGYIADVAKVKVLGNIPTVDDEATVEAFFPQARKEVKKFMGKELYELFASGDEWAADADYDDTDTELMQTAEAYMVLAYAVGPLNVNSSGAGFVKSTGFGDSRKEVLSQNDISELSFEYRKRAEELLEDYVTDTDTDEDCNPDTVQAGSLKMSAI